MSKGVTLTGDREFRRALRKALKKAPEVTAKVIKNGAEFGKNEIQDKAPVDTGHMKLNVITQYPELNVALIISRASYSAYVNYGTRFTSAQPFFTDGWEVTQKKLINDFKDVMKGVLSD